MPTGAHGHVPHDRIGHGVQMLPCPTWGFHVNTVPTDEGGRVVDPDIAGIDDTRGRTLASCAGVRSLQWANLRFIGTKQGNSSTSSTAHANEAWCVGHGQLNGHEIAVMNE
jgi:hypothetical protein